MLQILLNIFFLFKILISFYYGKTSGFGFIQNFKLDAGKPSTPTMRNYLLVTLFSTKSFNKFINNVVTFAKSIARQGEMKTWKTLF